MHTPESPASPVDEARVAIWRLFEEGYVDEDAATASLLAVDLGTRRQSHAARMPPPVEHPPRPRRQRRAA